MRIRTDNDANYKAIFFDGKTIRQKIRLGERITMSKHPEIEDVAINNKCLAACSYCYTSALRTGINFGGIVEKANNIWGGLSMNDRPFQIAIGGAGESTMHPDWIDFVRAVRDLEIVPNYTTNGMHLTPEILKATSEYCGGVAVSYHPHIVRVFNEAMIKYSGIDTSLNVHLIIGDRRSLIDAKDIYERYKGCVDYFVMLPYQAAGRATALDTDEVWLEMFRWIESLPLENKNQFAFGALFYEFLMRSDMPLKINTYEPEIYSGYRIFDDTYDKLRVSSYNLNLKTPL